MGKKKDISPSLNGKIQGLLSSKTLSNKKIATMVGVSPQTVMRIKKKLISGTSTMSGRENCKGKPKTTAREDKIIINTVLKYRAMTIRWVCWFIFFYHAIQISVDTIKRRLRKNGIKCYKKAKKFLLNIKMTKKRKKWAFDMLRWGPRHWGQVRF